MREYQNGIAHICLLFGILVLVSVGGWLAWTNKNQQINTPNSTNNLKVIDVHDAQSN